MADTMRKKGTIGILTGGGDVPGLNPAIRAATLRAIREGYEVIGLRRGWAGPLNIIRDKDADNSEYAQVLTEQIVDQIIRTGGTFLRTSRTRPSHVARQDVPTHLRDQYDAEMNDLTPEVVKNLEFLGIEYLIPIGGDDTLSYGVHLHQFGLKVIGIPKTMDNDVPGTEYCIGFSTCITRTIEALDVLRTIAASSERILVLEVFGRYAGFSAILPAMAGVADRCVIPEYEFNIERLTELLVRDRQQNPDNLAVVLVSEGATMEGGGMVFQDSEIDAYGHATLGGIGDRVSAGIKRHSATYNGGTPVGTLSQRLSYLVRGGNPDAVDSLVPMAYGNLAIDLILSGASGRLVVLLDGRYDSVPLDVVTSAKKLVDVEKHYDTDQLRPRFEGFGTRPMFFMTSL
jgi:6-phosphofructokinase 1